MFYVNYELVNAKLSLLFNLKLYREMFQVNFQGEKANGFQESLDTKAT